MIAKFERGVNGPLGLPLGSLDATIFSTRAFSDSVDNEGIPIRLSRCFGRPSIAPDREVEGQKGLDHREGAFIIKDGEAERKKKGSIRRKGRRVDMFSSHSADHPRVYARGGRPIPLPSGASGVTRGAVATKVVPSGVRGRRGSKHRVGTG